METTLQKPAVLAAPSTGKATAIAYWIVTALAKVLGLLLLLAPTPARLKEWVYAGFAIVLASALVAHVAVGDGAQAWGWAAGTAVLWALSYVFWRRLQSAAGTRL